MFVLVYLSTIATLIATAVGGFHLYEQAQEAPQAQSIAGNQVLFPIIEPLTTDTPSPSPEADEQTPQPTANTRATTSLVQRASTPTPTPRPSTTPRPAVAGATTDGAVSIEFIDLPSKIHHREGFTIAWTITGPEGAKGQNSTLTTSFHAKNTSEGSKVSVNNDTSNSYGSFTVPKTFSSKFKFGGVPGTVEIVVTADVNGQSLREERSITLTE